MTIIEIKQAVRCSAPMCREKAEISIGNVSALSVNRLYFCGKCAREIYGLLKEKFESAEETGAEETAQAGIEGKRQGQKRD